MQALIKTLVSNTLSRQEGVGVPFKAVQCNRRPLTCLMRGLLVGGSLPLTPAVVAPTPLFKPCPCPSYSGRRDRIDLIPNWIQYQM